MKLACRFLLVGVSLASLPVLSPSQLKLHAASDLVLAGWRSYLSHCLPCRRLSPHKKLDWRLEEVHVVNGLFVQRNVCLRVRRCSLTLCLAHPPRPLFTFTHAHTHKRQPGTTHTACGVNRDIERPSALRHTNSVLLYFLRLVGQLLIPNVSRLTARRKKQKRPPWTRRRHRRVLRQAIV